ISAAAPRSAPVQIHSGWSKLEFFVVPVMKLSDMLLIRGRYKKGDLSSLNTMLLSVDTRAL
uniref:Uncharacterized protein n=1 Tax=Labrus bergylta TaxID=56723 RepID=A0A3Q3EY52_9LABR